MHSVLDIYVQVLTGHLKRYSSIWINERKTQKSQVEEDDFESLGSVRGSWNHGSPKRQSRGLKTWNTEETPSI